MPTALAVLAATTPTPSPSPTSPPADTVTPGVAGFFAILFLALASALLIWDMLRRVRRARYREQVAEELDAEERERSATSSTEEGEEPPAEDAAESGAEPSTGDDPDAPTPDASSSRR